MRPNKNAGPASPGACVFLSIDRNVDPVPPFALKDLNVSSMRTRGERFTNPREGERLRHVLGLHWVHPFGGAHTGIAEGGKKLT